ncbi:hypothetical protein SDC9_193172 [bioreactor metagenome]|uniref:Uncharacterized protein n=1 Tax=bioreactor metagenome TaxID=1076179 RepID=A0A645I2U4_9ZZZZ
MISEDIGVTKPAPGVMDTNPATAPLAAPRTVGLLRWIHSTAIQDKAAAAAEVLVVTKAEAASPLAPRALPALNPNHPNQSRPAPKTVIGRLWGSIGSSPRPFLLPNISAATKPVTPELIWTTVPPAKSRAPIVLKNPPTPQTI